MSSSVQTVWTIAATGAPQPTAITFTPAAPVLSCGRSGRQIGDRLCGHDDRWFGVHRHPLDKQHRSICGFQPQHNFTTARLMTVADAGAVTANITASQVSPLTGDIFSLTVELPIG